MLFLFLELPLVSVMADTTTHPTDKVLKMIGGLYGKRKEEKAGYVVLGGQKMESQDTACHHRGSRQFH